MPSRKSNIRVLSTGQSKHNVLSEGESAQAFINLLQHLPESPSLGEDDERPTKRTRFTGIATCIARQELLLRLKGGFADDAKFTRQDIGAAMSLRLTDMQSVQQDSGWELQITPRTKAYKPFFCISHRLAQHDVSAKTAAALHFVQVQGFDPGEGGYLWASTDIDVKEKGDSAEASFTIRIMWNESHGVPLYHQTPVQQKKLREKALEIWFPGAIIIRSKHQAASWTPQDFYQSAYIPDKLGYDSATSSMVITHLTTSLYPFQRRAVQWLLEREGVHWQQGQEGNSNSGVVPYTVVPDELPLSFIDVQDADGNPVSLSPLFGVVARDPSRYRPHLRGGILAEEMGLGKTLEIIALILLHQRPSDVTTTVFDPYLGREVRSTGATLIVTPSSLLDQWLSELGKHAPHLYVLHYEGIKKSTKNKITAEMLGMYDVVITTYDVLQSEVYAALDPPDRSRRKERQYERPRSPLVELSWWRVCVDEAQMVENATSNAAILARILPRVNAWCITGTPVKDDIQKDLRGLLSFLRLEPYASDAHIWKYVASVDKTVFGKLFNLIAMRHTKSQVRSEIALPPQKRYVITMPFTAVEEQHYQTLFKELAETCGLDIEGNPLRNDWDVDEPMVQNSMRIALDRLRQTALHPEVGARNRRALGRKAGPMRTVAEVLTAMLDQSENALRVDQRGLLALRLLRGQVLAGMGQVTEARELWEAVRSDTDAMVSETRDELKKEIADAKLADKTKASATLGADPPRDFDSDSEESVPPRVGEARRRLRYALEIQHKAAFFCANAYYSIKSDTKMTLPDSDKYKQLEKMEVESYDNAQSIRKEILQDSYGKAKRLMDKIEAAASAQDFAVIPELKGMGQKGIESRNIADAFDEMCAVLDAQANQLDDWRETAIQFLLKPLVDEDKEGEITGEEYEESTKLQEEIEVYVEALRATVADRLAALSGQKNALVEHNAKTLIRMAQDEEGPFPERLLELFNIRDKIKPAVTEGEPLSSLKGVISELRTLSVKLRHDAATGNSRATAELSIVRNQLQIAQKQLSEQTKVANMMEQEAEKFMDTLNARLEFYRQLQTVSDMVAEYQGATDAAGLKAVLDQEKALQSKLTTAEAKHRYLLHLQEADSSTSAEQRMCVICQSTFSIGVLTVCGHQFCKECITLWFRAHRNCPVCKRQLTQANLHDITLKPKELKLHSETNPDAAAGLDHLHASPFAKKTSTIYTEFNPEKLAEIQNIDLEGPNYTTKVDTLVRHLLWLRESDPGAKSIVFSQYKEFLDVLALAFRRYRVGYTSFDKAHGISGFKEDPSIEVFLLHARAHSSGLNLVNASHVFLCEPLLNTALELQAIARVDRIGQEQETTVWLYIVDGTVEESIYNLSVQRRMEHMGQSLKGKSKESTPELLDANLDAANTLELQNAHLSKLMGRHGISGEAVDKKDLWSCLFGVNRGSAREQSPPQDPAVRGFLAAEAAEERMRNGI